MKRDWQEVIAKLLIYIGAFTFLIYGLLKAFGVINTPVWILAIPYVVGGITLLGVVLYFGKLISKIESNGKILKGYERMKDDFISVRDKQKMCLNGELKGSPY